MPVGQLGNPSKPRASQPSPASACCVKFATSCTIDKATAGSPHPCQNLHELQVHQLELEMQNDELRRTQIALDLERQRYFDLYDMAPVGYCTVTAQGLILEANLTAATLLGVQRGRLVWQRFSHFIAPSDQDIYYQSRKQLLATHEAQSCELQLVSSTGQPFWARLMTTVAKINAQAPVIRIVLSDISQTKQVEQALIDSELRFRQLFEKNTSVMLLIEPSSGTILEANLTAASYYGYPQAHLVGMCIHDINTFSPQQIAMEMQQALQEERNYFLFQHRLAGGDLREVEVYSTPITIAGQCVLLSIVHDIAVRVRLRRELDRVMQEQEAILNSDITGIVKVRNRSIVWSNATFADMVGYTPQALIGQLTRILYPNEAASQALAQAAYPVLQNGKTFRGEVQLQRQDGSPLWVKLNGALLASDNAESIWAFADISRRKTTELALAQAERALRSSEQQMVIAQRISGTGSWAYKLASDTIWCSAEGLRLFGFAPVAGDMPLNDIEDCIPERQRVHQALLDLTSQGSGFDLEFEIRPADGSKAKTIRSVARLEPDAQGQPLMVQGFVQDITKLQLMGEQIRQLAFYDPLTNLPNRRLFLDRLSQAITAGQRTKRYGALMYLDLDNFKPVNDNHGHEAGDLLLIEVAHRLNQCVRETDTVARLGGDEFVVLMGGLDTDARESTRLARVVAEKIRLSLAQAYRLQTTQQPNGTPAPEHHCSASLGVVVFSRQHQNANTILQWADAAMYQAKDAGRNRVHFYDHAPTP